MALRICINNIIRLNLISSAYRLHPLKYYFIVKSKILFAEIELKAHVEKFKMANHFVTTGRFRDRMVKICSKINSIVSLNWIENYFGPKEIVIFFKNEWSIARRKIEMNITSKKRRKKTNCISLSFHFYSLIVNFRHLAMGQWLSIRKSGQQDTVERSRLSQRMIHPNQFIWLLSSVTKPVWRTLFVKLIVQVQVSIRISFDFGGFK